MKTDNIFDYLENEDTIKDDTVIENTGVRTENVMKLVNQEISSSNIKPLHSKGKTFKRVVTILIAAVVATAVTAKATGSFDKVFGNFLEGESPDGVYGGKNLLLESDYANVEFLGIAGDNNTAVTSMRVTKKDGTPFVDSIENTWISASSSGQLNETFQETGLLDDTFWGDVIADISFSSDAKLDEYDKVENGFGFYFEDNSTINAYIVSNASKGGLKGETMNASVSGISAYTITEVLYDYLEFADENVDEEGYYINEDFHEKFPELLDKYGIEEQNGVIMKINPETRDVVLAKETPLDVDIRLSVKMSYDSSTRTVTAKNLSEFYPYFDEGKIYIQPFTMTIHSKHFNNNIDSSEDVDIPSNITITLDDGSTVNGCYQTVIGSHDLMYRYYTDHMDGTRFRPIAIDPESVVSITANGVDIM